MKTAVIFGGSRGIGAEIAREFAAKDYFVVIGYNNSKECADMLVDSLLKEGKQGIAIKADVSCYDEVESLVNKTLSITSSIDVAVINAGISKTGLLIDSSIEDINKVISTNLLGAIYCCKAISKVMCLQHYGKIINIASMWGEVGASCESVYSASKGGIIALTKSLAGEGRLSVEPEPGWRPAVPWGRGAGLSVAGPALARSPLLPPSWQPWS